MTARLLASDKVVLLLALVPYLREHGPTTVHELAKTFEVEPSVLRTLISFLGTAGIPGETLAYQHNDLFDIDWGAFEHSDVVSLTHTVAIEDAPRLTGAETAALLAGLHALTPMLSEEDAGAARSLAQRLSESVAPEPLSVAVEAASLVLSELVSAVEYREQVRFRYVDLGGTESVRTVRAEELFEREGVWYLRGHNVERDADRTFRVAQVSDLFRFDRGDAASDTSEMDSVDADCSARSARSVQQPSTVITEILAHVPERLLPVIRGFAPEIIKAADVPTGIVRVRIEAWHPGTAVRLAQHAPGTIEIIAPPAARAAVSEWAENALAEYENEYDG